MAYTDNVTTNFSPVKSAHVSELKTAIDKIKTDTKTKDVASPSLTYNRVNINNILQLQNAIRALELRFSYNCCQSGQNVSQCTNKCQSCQNSCTECTTSTTKMCQDICNQCTDKCQSCQNKCICQSDACQTQCSQCLPPPPRDCYSECDCQSH